MYLDDDAHVTGSKVAGFVTSHWAYDALGFIFRSFTPFMFLNTGEGLKRILKQWTFIVLMFKTTGMELETE